MLPCAAYLKGEYGVKGTYVGVPVVIGARRRRADRRDRARRRGEGDVRQVGRVRQRADRRLQEDQPGAGLTGPSAFTEAVDEHPRVPGQGACCESFGLPVAPGVAVFTPDEAEAAAKRAPRPALGGEVADPRRRPRQGQVQGTRAGDKGGVRLAKSVAEVRQFAKEMLGETLVTDADRAGRQAGQPALHRGRLRRSTRSSTLGCWSTARPRASPSWSRPRAASTSRTSRMTRRRRSTPSPSIPRPGSCRITAAPPRDALGLKRRSRQAMRDADRRSSTPPSSPRTWRCSRSTRWSSPTQGQLQGARRQGVVRRQLALPPSRHGGVARRDRGGRQGDRGVQVRPQLRHARRHDRLHGQRRRPRHGDDGHHQALRREPRQLPRRRRRRHQGEGDGGVQDHHRRPAT